MAASRPPHRHQRFPDDLGLVLLDRCGFGHVNLPGGIPTHTPMMPQPPVELSESVYKEVRT